MLGVMLPLAFMATGCMGATPAEGTVQITALEPSERSVQAGSPAIASVRVKNAGNESRTFFIGYSVRDPTGEWYDAPRAPWSSDPMRNRAD